MVTTGAVSRAKLQSNRHYQETNTQFFTGRMPFLLPNQQKENVNCNYVVKHQLLTSGGIATVNTADIMILSQCHQTVTVSADMLD